MRYCLVSTNHLADALWFKDTDDYRAGMNLVAVVSCALGIPVLAFILMSNHVHFVLLCDRAKAELFITAFKKQYGRYYRLKYGTKELLRRNKVDIQELDPSDDSVEWAIAYTVMNSVAANLCISPGAYAWGTGNSYFQCPPAKGKRLDSLSGRARKRLLHSKADLPGGFLVSDNGYILPESYVRVRLVESRFRTPKRMIFYLSNSSKARQRLQTADEMIPAFSDQAIASVLPDLCRSLFGAGKASALSEPQLSELFRQVRFRFSSNIAQIARTTGFPPETVTRLLDTYK